MWLEKSPSLKSASAASRVYTYVRGLAGLIGRSWVGTQNESPDPNENRELFD